MGIVAVPRIGGDKDGHLSGQCCTHVAAFATFNLVHLTGVHVSVNKLRNSIAAATTADFNA